MSEASVIGHDAEYVQVTGLGIQVDGQFLAQSTVEIRVGPRTVKGPSNAFGRVSSRMALNSRTQSVNTSHATVPTYPRAVAAGPRRSVGQARHFASFRSPDRTGRGNAGRSTYRACPAPLAPTRVAVVVIEPDTVHGEILKHPAKIFHPGFAVAGMRRADSLPAVRRRADFAVAADGRRVGMVLQVAGNVHRVEFGEEPHALLSEQGNLLCRQAAGAVHTALMPQPASVFPSFISSSGIPP